MTKSIVTVSYTLSVAATLMLAQNAWGAQAQSQAQQGSTTQSQQGNLNQNTAQQGNQAGNINRNGITPPALTPPGPLDPAQQVSHTIDSNTTRGGIAWKNFLLYPEVSATVMYDDNIYAAKTNEKSDTSLTTSAEIRAKSRVDHHALEAGAGADLNRYQTYSTENTNDWWMYAKGSIDLAKSTKAYGGVSITRNHEDRSSSDAQTISALGGLAEPIRYTDVSGNIGLFHTFNDTIAVRVGASKTKLDYDDVPVIGSIPYDASVRDRTESMAGGRLILTYSDALEMFVQAASDDRMYVTGTDRNSHGYKAAAGFNYKVTDSLSTEAYVGRIRQDYDSGIYTQVSSPDYGGSITYKATEWTNLSASLDRSLEETIVSGASGYINTDLTARIDHRLSRDLSLNGSLTRQWSKYNDFDRTDVYSGASVGAKMYVTNAIYAGADYQFRQRHSTDTTADYNNNLFYLTIGTDFGTRVQPNYPVQ